MFTRDDVPHEQRLPSSITVTVETVRVNPKPRRESELTIRDPDGKALEVVIWETHEIDQSWEVGAGYEITGARGKRYPKRNDTNVELQDWILSRRRYHSCLAEHTIAGLNRRALSIKSFDLLRRAISQIARHIATNDLSALATIYGLIGDSDCKREFQFALAVFVHPIGRHVRTVRV